MSMHTCRCGLCGRELSPMFVVTGVSDGTAQVQKRWPCWLHSEPTKDCEFCYQAFTKLFDVPARVLGTT